MLCTIPNWNGREFFPNADSNHKLNHSQILWWRTFQYQLLFDFPLIRICSSHLALTEDRLKFFDWTDLTNNYENTCIWWYETIKINSFCQTLFEKTHFSVILYYKIDHFCPLKSNFHTFPAIWSNIWVWNSLLPCCYHLLVQVWHTRSLFFPFWYQKEWLNTDFRLKITLDFQKNNAYFWHFGLGLAQSLVPKGKKWLLACLTCTIKW